MADDLMIVWKPMDFSKYPDNLPERNKNALSAEQAQSLEDHILDMRRKQAQYLHSNLEIRAIIRLILRELIQKKPSEAAIPNVLRGLFKKCKYELQTKIDEYKNDLYYYYKVSDTDDIHMDSDYIVEPSDDFSENFEI